MVTRELPSGTVILLFTDIEGSTRLLQELGRERYVRALSAHRWLLRQAFTARGGVEVEMQGDSFHFAFTSARAAVEAAYAGQRALLEHDWEAEPIRVRIGLHAGQPMQAEGLYAGIDVHLAARVMSAGHGGQVLLSGTTGELVSDDLPAGLGLRDLGEHRLKDLAEPLRIYQLVGEGLRGEFSPLRTLYRANLPTPATQFVGREEELAGLIALMTRDDLRLLTLTGPGGSGKTRLALQAAAAVAERYPHGIFWISLAGLREPEFLVPSIARTLGADGDVREAIADRHVLLLLDNFEQLVGAAPKLSSLLGACPNLRLLVTSREPLRLSSEHEYPVPPLGEADSVALFQQRAGAIGGDLAADGEIAEICRRLDHLPLAIELAAARSRMLDPQLLLERLEQRLPLLTGGPRDAPERQRTLESTLAWSYELLAAEEQRVFAGLSVFVGGCTLEAAEEVCDADLDTLQSLVEKSLVLRAGERIRMLETIREYAAAQLSRVGSAFVRGRQAAYFVTVAEQAEVGLQGRERSAWRARLDDERDNFRAALDWAGAAGEVELELRLATALREFWTAHGPLAEGLSRLQGALDRAGEQLPERRLQALGAAALIALSVGDQRAADRLARDLLELSRELGDRRSEVSALIKLSHSATDSGRGGRARSLMEAALTTARDSGDAESVARALLNFADLALRGGEDEHAAELAEQSLEEGGDELDSGLKAIALLNLARARLRLRDITRGTEAARQALELSAQQLDDSLLSDALAVLAAAYAGHDPERAARVLGAAEALREEVGAEPDPLDQEAADAIRESLNATTYERAYAEGRVLSFEGAVKLARESPG